MLKLLAYLAILPAALLGAEEKGFVPIFNGKDLDGWDSKPGMWEVRDAEIWCTGKSKEKNWLIWRKEQPADFILRLEFRWDKGNSGVQVRSDDLGKWQVFGYQAEVASQDKMGLWHHSLLAKDHPRKKERHLMAPPDRSPPWPRTGPRRSSRAGIPRRYSHTLMSMSGTPWKSSPRARRSPTRSTA